MRLITNLLLFSIIYINLFFGKKVQAKDVHIRSVVEDSNTISSDSDYNYQHYNYQQCELGRDAIFTGANQQGLLAQPPIYQFKQDQSSGQLSIVIREEVKQQFEQTGTKIEYSKFMNCNWIVEIPKGYFIRVIMSKLSLEFYPSDKQHDIRPMVEQARNHPCRYDFFRVINNFNIHAWNNRHNSAEAMKHQGDYILQFCREMSEKLGDQMVFDFTSSTNKVLFSFVSDKDMQKSGFVLHYKFVPIDNMALKIGNYTMEPINPLILGTTSYSGDTGSNPEQLGPRVFFILFPMMFMIFVICHNINKTYELEQLHNQAEFGGLGRGGAWYNENGVLELSRENIPNNVHRAQNALVRGLLQRRDSVIDLSRRLIQEDIAINNQEAAARDIPPTYETVLNRMGFGNNSNTTINHNSDNNNNTNNNNSSTRISRAPSRLSAADLNELQDQLNVDGPPTSRTSPNNAISDEINGASRSLTSFMNFFNNRRGGSNGSRISALELENILIGENNSNIQRRPESARTDDSQETVVPNNNNNSNNNNNTSPRNITQIYRSVSAVSPLPPIQEGRVHRTSISSFTSLGNENVRSPRSVSSASTVLPSYNSAINIPDYHEIDV